jgi:chorismate synthase
MAGAVARKVLDYIGVEVLAHTVEIGGIQAERKTLKELKKNIEVSPLKCADPAAALEMMRAIETAQAEGDSIGGVIEGIAFNVPVGLGEPIFDTLEGDLAKAVFAIPAVKGVEFGSGLNAARKKGSKKNDAFAIKKGKIITLTDNAGGILGGISDGMPIVLRAAVKPPPSISQSQKTIDLQKLTNADLEIRGRHDACIVPRAVPIVESMMAVTLCDFAIRARIIPEVLK